MPPETADTEKIRLKKLDHFDRLEELVLIRGICLLNAILFCAKPFFMNLVKRDERCHAFLDAIGRLLGHKSRRSIFAMYFIGLMSSLGRKTAEGIATLFSDEDSVRSVHLALQQMLARSKWKDAPVRKYSVEYAIESLPEHDPVEYWIVDDTGFIKKGSHSVGVQRQYTGTSGKIDNCQIGVSLSLATAQRQLPVDFRLYLPHSWTENRARRKAARIPPQLHFKTKPELAVEMIESAVEGGYARGILLADSAYGNNSRFRKALRRSGLDFSVDIQGNTKLWRLDKEDKRRGRATTAESLGRKLSFERIVWTEGTKRELASRFAFVRVVVEGDVEDEQCLNPVWLGVEHPYDEEDPKKYFLCSLPRSTAHQDRVRIHKSRWRTERMYQDMKGVFGLDHYEGRSYPGWNHHVTAAMAAYSYSFAEQARLFPPEAPRAKVRGVISKSHRTPFRGLNADYGASQLWGVARLLAALSLMSPEFFRENESHSSN